MVGTMLFDYGHDIIEPNGHQMSICICKSFGISTLVRTAL